MVVREALSELELLDVSGVGTLEAFNTDGLRTLLTTSRVPNMKEKTLRYPGHVEYVMALKQSGFFSKEEKQKIYIGQKKEQRQSGCFKLL